MGKLKTKKVYWNDPYLEESVVKIVDISPEGVLLDQTIIFPGGGGQDRDFGILIASDGAEFPITKVIKKDQELYHILEGSGSANFIVGDDVTLKLDWTRRYAHMRAHTSQHVFSAFLLDHFDVNTIDITLSPEEVTLVLDKEIDFTQLEAAIAGVNAVVTSEPRDIQSVVGTSKTIKKKYGSKIRGGVPEGEEVRVLSVDGWDVMCCGGTHVKNTREIGPIMVYKFNKKKEIRYYIGDKALNALAAVNVSGLHAAGALSQSIENIAEEIDKRLQEVERLRDTVKMLEGTVLDHLLTSPGTSVGDAMLKTVEVPINRKLLSKIIKKMDKNTIICAQLPENMVMILSTHGKANAKLLLEKYFEAFGGKGGGSPRSGQGKLKMVIPDFPAIAQKFVEDILNS